MNLRRWLRKAKRCTLVLRAFVRSSKKFYEFAGKKKQCHAKIVSNWKAARKLKMKRCAKTTMYICTFRQFGGAEQPPILCGNWPADALHHLADTMRLFHEINAFLRFFFSFYFLYLLYFTCRFPFGLNLTRLSVFFLPNRCGSRCICALILVYCKLTLFTCCFFSYFF